MRTETEMMELILGVAREDDRIRAVYMNGSRANPNAPKDIFQDYDIVYVVNETASFIRDKDWPGRFGEVLFMQYPDECPDYPSDKASSYGWLMVFKDGVRLDLTAKAISHAKETILDDSLCVVLLDKDGILPVVPASSDASYRVHRPSEELFASVCNEFWWCLNNVAKGLWRNELSYAQDMLSHVVRKQLETVLSWKIGVLTDFSVSIGKSGKYMHKWLTKEEWQAYLDTYSAANADAMWKSVETMCRLFYDASSWVAERLGFSFNKTEADNSLLYMNRVKELSPDAAEIF